MTSTYFASPERSNQGELERQKNIFAEKDLHLALLNATSECLIVLNKNREIVYANDAFNELFADSKIDTIIGKRTGEVLHCRNAFTNSAGCGTSEFCRTCGAVQAILSSLSGNEDIQECRILTENSAEALDLRVRTKPLEIDGEIFSIFSFIDISNEKRRLALERIFFHDVLNTASAIKSYIKILPESSGEEKDELSAKASILIDELLEEIQSQRDFSLAEINELDVNPQKCSTIRLINDVSFKHKVLPDFESKEIEIDENSVDITFNSDPLLVSRILSNMLKNSIEAAETGEKVKIGAQSGKDKVRFYVHNASYMPPDVQAQIFQRSFSTKGKGRGLGTYSMKLLTERYLEGKVFFNSSPEEGTTFIVELPLSLVV